MLTPDAANALSTGLALGAASIVSVGPNNLMMLREGLVRGHVGLVAGLVWTSYLALLTAAFLLTDVLANSAATARTPLAWLGLIALAWFALSSMRTALRRQPLGVDENVPREPRRTCFYRVLTVVWLNPLTYLELLLVPAALCGRYENQGPRLGFVLGLGLMAAVCCAGYALGGSACLRTLRDARVLRAFDMTASLLLASLAAVLCDGLLTPTH